MPVQCGSAAGDVPLAPCLNVQPTGEGDAGTNRRGYGEADAEVDTGPRVRIVRVDQERSAVSLHPAHAVDVDVVVVGHSVGARLGAETEDRQHGHQRRQQGRPDGGILSHCLEPLPSESKGI